MLKTKRAARKPPRRAPTKSDEGAGFFRDPDSFKALIKIFPTVVAPKAGGKIRVWCPGCSSGEELYSIAILLLESLGNGNSTNRLQLFGTDINAAAIDVARTGLYPESIEAYVSHKRLDRFFVKTYTGYQIIKSVREMCVFAVHDLSRHPPLSKMDLISFRNVLMHFTAPLQAKILSLMHYALNPNGFLFLDKSESIRTEPDVFTLVDRKYEIYAKKTVVSGYITDAIFTPFRPKTPRWNREEAQSTIEELETTKAELQSANQELTAVNGELSSRTARLDALSNDLNNVLAGIEIPVLILEKDHRVRRFTPEAGKELKMIPRDLGRRITDIGFYADIPRLDEMIDEAVRECRVIKREVRDRSGKWYLLSVHPYKTADDTIDGSLLTLIDIDEFKTAREELRSLLSRLTSVQESNNRILARELHDDISPSVAALSLNVTTLANQLANSPDILRKSLYKISDDIGKLAGNIHHLSRQLHPSILYDLGLQAGLKAECAAFSQRHHIPCHFAAENVPRSIPEDATLCLYRVAQDALRNVGKHANAESVKIRLAGIDGTIELSISDIGDGFDLAEKRKSKGVGLISMEERVRMINGQFSITSQKGKGTTVVVRVPLTKGKREKAKSAAG